MGLASIFRSGKYFDKNIQPKCDYCQFGKRAKDGNKVLCEKKGLVESNYSCSKFSYSPLKRIPIKQLNFVGSLADDDIYIESASDRAEKEEEQKENASVVNENNKSDEKKAETNQNEEKSENTDVKSEVSEKEEVTKADSKSDEAEEKVSANK